jgi:disulfide bond formation protein DsbB
MYTTTQAITTILAILTVVTQVFIVVTIIAYLAKFKKWTNFFEKHALKIAMAISTLAIFGPLYFSEVAGWTPCKLCWFQRIAIFPVFVLLITTFISKDYKGAPKFILPLNIIGVLISGYHYIQQIVATINPTSAFLNDCSIVGNSPSCSEYFTMKFGYITLPHMALTAGLAFILLMIMQIRQNKKA